MCFLFCYLRRYSEEILFLYLGLFAVGLFQYEIRYHLSIVFSSLQILALHWTNLDTLQSGETKQGLYRHLKFLHIKELIPTGNVCYRYISCRFCSCCLNIAASRFQNQQVGEKEKEKEKTNITRFSNILEPFNKNGKVRQSI